ncbi:hypothetical protein GCM10023142_00130 [Anaerocolumna aminovalerica]|uniref:Uncharacterized protein n=1 Tax=Anaerocolumna aminovalerica TaxID=1527 RepID=A0A1I5G2A7_9FIRM|nr:hypothetical protein [Anaerocolumna aminovalerica]SFO30102.1 hypothetical protein SAMN04489757_11715 [Anaerocolumna aminovalerica]
MRERKDNKGRNNINKKDHQLKIEPSTDCSTDKTEDKAENKIQNRSNK